MLNIILQYFKKWKKGNKSRKKGRKEGEAKKYKVVSRCSQFWCLRTGYGSHVAEACWLWQLHDTLHGEWEAESKRAKEQYLPVLKCCQEDSIRPGVLGLIKFKIKVSWLPRQFCYLRNRIKCWDISGVHINK